MHSQCRSLLHIHGTEDNVIFFEGDTSDPDPEGAGKTAFYRRGLRK